MAKEITIDGIAYVPKDSIQASPPAKALKGMKFCLVRGAQSGVYAGYVKSQVGQEVVILNARNLWFWKGASALSQLSQEGVKFPNECKFTGEVPEMKLLDAVQVIECSAKAKENIASVPVWKQ